MATIAENAKKMRSRRGKNNTPRLTKGTKNMPRGVGRMINAPSGVPSAARQMQDEAERDSTFADSEGVDEVDSQTAFAAGGAVPTKRGWGKARGC